MHRAEAGKPGCPLGSEGEAEGMQNSRASGCCQSLFKCVRGKTVLSCKEGGKRRERGKEKASVVPTLPWLEGLPPTAGHPAPARPGPALPSASPATAWHRRSVLLKSHKLRTSRTAQFNIKEHRQSLFSMSARPGCSGHRQCPAPSPVAHARDRSSLSSHASPGDSPGAGRARHPGTLPPHAACSAGRTLSQAHKVSGIRLSCL